MRRFFHPTSFWNQPIGSNPEIDPESPQLLAFMAQSDDRGFWLNLKDWTIPIYEVDRNTPRRKVYRRFETLTWDGLLQGDDLVKIKLAHYRVMKMENVIPQGMGHRLQPQEGIGPDLS